MEDSVKGIKSQILYDWRNHFETRSQFELFITQIDMLIEAVEKECRLTKRALDGARFCPACHALLEEGSVYCDTCGTDTPRQ